MAEYFTEDADAALKVWLSISTWYTSHPLDEARFYRFVDALYKNDDWQNLRKTLMRAVTDYQPKVSQQFAEEQVNSLAHRAEIVFAFLQAIKTSDAD